MAVPQGLAYFPGILKIVSARYTLSHGITPGVCFMEIAPQATITAAGGALQFKFGSQLMVFPDCRVDKFSFRQNSQGQVIGLNIYDRRWKWGLGYISGSYNLVKPDDQNNIPALDAALRKNARELALLCLAAMGEKKYDVSQIPTTIYPPVEWDWTNPAQALCELAEQCGCRIVLRLNGSVMLAKAGAGQSLPMKDRMEESDGIDPPEVPDSIVVVCGKTLYSANLELEPVGLDTDGVTKHIDQLSYKPATGWANSDLTFFGGLSSLNPDLPAPTGAGLSVPQPGSPQDLAQRTVYKWYRPVISETDPLTVPGFTGPQLKFLDQILPLDEKQNDVHTQNGKSVRKDPQVFGVFARLNSTGRTNTTAISPYSGDFTVKPDTGIVEFKEPAFRWNFSVSNPSVLPATIRLRIAFSIRPLPTYAPVRHTSELKVPGAKWNTGPRVLLHDEIVKRVSPVYGTTAATATQITTTFTNDEQTQPEIDYYLKSALAEYQITGQREVGYAGLVPIDPDGAIQQVSWSVGMSGATTRASLNSEFSAVTPSYQQRRIWESLRNQDLADAPRPSQRRRRNAR